MRIDDARPRATRAREFLRGACEPLLLLAFAAIAPVTAAPVAATQVETLAANPAGMASAETDIIVRLDTETVDLEFPSPMQIWSEDAANARAVRVPGARIRTCWWNDDTRLRCAFEDNGKPAQATAYPVALTAGLRTQTGEALPALTFRAETPRPRLSASISGWRGGRPQIVIESSAEVMPESVAAVLRLHSGDRALPAPALIRMPKRFDRDKVPRFALRLPDGIAPGAEIALSVVPGLISSEGPLPGTQNARLLSAIDREPFQLRAIECMGRKQARTTPVVDGEAEAECIAGEALTLSFSRMPDEESRVDLGAALPQGLRVLGWSQQSWYMWAPLGETTARSPAAVLNLRIEAPEREFAMPLKDILRAQDDGTALASIRLRLRSTQFRPQLRAASTANLVADAASASHLAESVNAARTTLPVLTFDRELRREDLTLPDSRGAVRAVSSPATERALAQGGWARWNPRASRPLDFAAPQFDLQAIGLRDTLLVWAWAWDGSNAIANAEVELLWLRNPETPPRAVATARTGADGIATLRLPEDFALPEITTRPGEKADTPMWLLRATDGSGRRAVLPVTGYDGNALSATLLGRARDDVRVWGVADRPLYRAGDTVRFRLWQRVLEAGRLRAIARPQPLELVLYNIDEQKALQRWQATPTAEGALIGEVRLPEHANDATYCIGIETDRGWSGVEGTCFFVGTYRAQDLWAEATSNDRVLRDGERFVVDVVGGYYSGGPASGVRIAKVTTRLSGLPLQVAYPDYADYTFVDTDGELWLPTDETPQAATDAEGRARVSLPVDFTDEEPEDIPAFGELQTIAELSLAARESVASNAAKARYAHYRHYVGLRAEPRWFDATAPLHLSGMVIDAEGRRQPGERIEVAVDFLPDDGDQKAKPQRLTVCALAAEAQTLCDFPRKRSGRYRLTARSGDAAPAEIERYVWVDDARLAPSKANKPFELELLAAPEAGAPARLLLRHVPAPADVLLVVEADGEWLAQQTLRADADTMQWQLPIAADGRKQVTVHAFARRRGVAAETTNGLRTPLTLSTATVDVPLPTTQTPSALEVAFDRASARPGDTVRLRLHNRGARTRTLALSVNDDGLRALAADWLPFFDPHSEYWLGADFQDWQDRPMLVSFASWPHQPWQWLLPWPDENDDTMPEIEGARVPGFAGGVAAPVMTLDRTQANTANTDNVGDVLFDLSAHDGGALQNEVSDEYDTVVVTGSRIKAPEFIPGPSRERGLRPLRRENAAATSSTRAPRLRIRFADTALWRPDLSLAPGETREIELTLPDNLTRWRASVWSSDADDGFELAEAVLETGLPVEVRLQTPVRLYPDDRAVLAANVRNAGDAPITLASALQVDAPSAEQRQTLAMPARGQTRLALEIAPRDADLTADGTAATMTAIASVRDDDAGDARAEDTVAADAVAASIELASPRIETRKAQAGWLGEEALRLQLPALPAGADDAVLQVSLLPGIDGFAQRWIEDLRDYPHRCWEQILSRAVAAAVALQRGEAAHWPGAKDAVREALENAPVFQNREGDFRYFAEATDESLGVYEPRPQIALTAYSVRALRFLRALGHPVPASAIEDADRFLGKQTESLPQNLAAMQKAGTVQPSAKQIEAATLAAFAASTQDVPEATVVDALWRLWPSLPLPAKLATARTMQRSGHRQTAQAITALAAQTQHRGAARAFRLEQRDDRWMSSDLREQCEFIDLLTAARDAGDPALRRALIAGLGDLYAGGIESVDTQTGTSCLMAAQSLGRERAQTAAVLEIAHDRNRATLRLDASAPAPWRAPLNAETATQPLHLTPHGEGAAAASFPASYLAEVRYREDARTARASASGFALERGYAVLRDGAWVPIDGRTLRDGDWIRITLTLRTAAPRYFVALTDAVPGGLRPTDLALGGIAGLDLERVSDTGSAWFATRRLDPRAPKFYAELLPAGEHQVHYFARVGNAGDYLAAPAIAELMYGTATRARTAATRIRIEEAPTGRGKRGH